MILTLFERCRQIYLQDFSSTFTLHLHEGCKAYTISMAEEFQTFKPEPLESLHENIRLFTKHNFFSLKLSSLRDCGDLTRNECVWTPWFKIYSRINVMYHLNNFHMLGWTRSRRAPANCMQIPQIVLQLLTGCRFGVLGFLATVATLGWRGILLCLNSTSRHSPTSWLPFLCCQLEVFFPWDLHSFQLKQQLYK